MKPESLGTIVTAFPEVATDKELEFLLTVLIDEVDLFQRKIKCKYANYYIIDQLDKVTKAAINVVDKYYISDYEIKGYMYLYITGLGTAIRSSLYNDNKYTMYNLKHSIKTAENIISLNRRCEKMLKMFTFSTYEICLKLLSRK